MDPFQPGVIDVRADSALQQRFITRVYGWMGLGLLLTGMVAMYTASSQAMLSVILGNRMVFYGLILAEIAVVFGLSMWVKNMSPTAATAAFLGYSALNGLTFSVIFLVYTSASIASTFVICAGMFGAMAAYGALTKRDLTSVGSFMFMGLVGIVIASVVNIWLRSAMVSWVTAFLGVIIFTGLTAYDAQKVKDIGASLETDDDNAKRAGIMGALSLYLDFINLFLSLLRLFGNRR